MVQSTLVFVDDDFADTERFRRAVQEASLPCELQLKSGGDEALDYLATAAEHNRLAQKTLVILDINMPGLSGHQVLEAIRADPRLQRIIVFMLTTSNHEQDRRRAYDNHVAGYFTKANLAGLLQTLRSYVDYAEFPPMNL